MKLTRAMGLVLLVACKHDDGALKNSSAGPASDPPALARGSIKSGDRDRTFAYFVPAASGGAMPLVVALHGRLGTGEAQEKLTHMTALAAREHFIVVYPDGVDRSWHDLRDVGPAAEKNVDDVTFLSELLSYFIEKNMADSHRVYMTGMSNGGFMSVALACKLSSRVAAIAPVAATAPDDLAAKCAPEKPIPALFIDGDHDPLVPYEGGAMGKDGKRGNALSAKNTARFFAHANGCDEAATESDLPDTDPNDGTTSASLRFDHGCKDNAVVELVTVKNGGHTWPGGRPYAPEMFIGKTSRDFSANERIWLFFKDKTR